MKTAKQNGQGLHLQISNHRWNWMVGATAATAAGVTAPQVSAITINLAGNYISDDAGNHLNADLTGDGHPDLTIASAHFLHATGFSGGTPSPYYGVRTVRVNLNGVLASAVWRGYGDPYFGTVRLGSQSASWGQVPTSVSSTFGTRTLTGSIPIFFKDLHINGGAPTQGFLEVTVFGAYPMVQLDSFTYNAPVKLSASTVPDEGSSLALLAMGAGGILALRRWRAAQGLS
jgi:hypothetical protein